MVIFVAPCSKVRNCLSSRIISAGSPLGGANALIPTGLPSTVALMVQLPRQTKPAPEPNRNTLWPQSVCRRRIRRTLSLPPGLLLWMVAVDWVPPCIGET